MPQQTTYAPHVGAHMPSLPKQKSTCGRVQACAAVGTSEGGISQLSPAPPHFCLSLALGLSLPLSSKVLLRVKLATPEGPPKGVNSAQSRLLDRMGMESPWGKGRRHRRKEREEGGLGRDQAGPERLRKELPSAPHCRHHPGSPEAG